MNGKYIEQLERIKREILDIPGVTRKRKDLIISKINNLHNWHLYEVEAAKVKVLTEVLEYLSKKEEDNV